MKTTQWVGAILVLAAVVFGITFVMNFLGGDSAAPDPRAAGRELPKLTFATKTIPELGFPLPCEVGKLGWQDFWFQNANSQDIQVGLNKKGCTCSEVEMFLPGQSYQEQLPVQSAALVGLLTVRQSSHVVTEWPVAWCTWNEAMVQRAAGAEKTTLTEKNAVTVPKGAVGWVRLKWSSEKADVRQLGATLWMEEEGASLTPLAAGVLITEPIKSDSRVKFGTIEERDLPRRASVRCWSLTRPRFRLEAKVVREGGSAAGDPFEVGAPVPLSEDECRQLEEEQQVRQVRSGYRVPLTLKARSADSSTASDLGHFARLVELSSPDEGINPLRVKVDGVVVGDVIVGRNQGGALHLGAFKGSRGARGQTLLETDLPDLKLELDQSRSPSFVKAELEESEAAPSGHRTWTLKVQVLPNRVRGSFPSQDDPAYRDSAVYVKTSGSQKRVIRIQLVGTASDG